MTAQPSGEGKLLLKRKVFRYAREGRVESLRSALSNLPPAVVKEVLHHRTQKDELFGEGTPLSIASEEGHLEVAQLLVENFNVDLDERVSAESLWPDKTALMCASQGGHLDIVKLLVTKGCTVNLKTSHERTALLFACEGNHLEVVRFLVENGARIDDDEDEKYETTCLMVACLHGSEELVECLLEKGANPNKASAFGFTALHIAAFNNDVKILEMLLKNGATMSIDSQGFSPLTKAANCVSADTVNFFVQSSYVGRKEKIESLELLGAKKAQEDITAGFEYLHQAMVMRHEDPSEVIPKPRSRLPARSGLMESRTLEELEARRLDPNQLRLECLAILLRIVGSSNAAPCFLAYIEEFVAAGRFSEALTNSVYALQIPEMAESYHKGFVFEISFALSSMLMNGQSPRVSPVCKVLEHCLVIFQQTKPVSAQSLQSSECFADLCLLCISVGLEVVKDQEEMELLQKLTESLVHLQPLIYSSGSVLHAAVSDHWDTVRHNTPVQDLHVDSLVSFLLRCGADANAVDNSGNRPLHVLTKCPEGYFDVDTLRSLTHALVEAGAPVGARNRKGEAPLDVAIFWEMAGVLLEFYPMSLQSLAASAVVKHRVPYAGQVPEILEEFLQRF